MQPITEIEVPEPVRPTRKLSVAPGGLRFAAMSQGGIIHALFVAHDEALTYAQSWRCNVIDITTGEKV